MIAYCGLICAECPAYIGTQTNDRELLEKTARRWSEMSGARITPDDILCDGCKSESGRRCAYCSHCEIRVCCIEIGLENCAHCSDSYECEKLNKFFKFAPDAKESLEELRKSL